MQGDLQKKRKIIRNYIRKHKNATYNDLRKIGVKVYCAYKKGMGEAFKDAGVKPPRSFKIKTKDEKRKIIIDYIRKNQGAGGHTIAKDTKINLSSVFNSIKEAYICAGIKYPRKVDKRDKSEKKKTDYQPG